MQRFSTTSSFQFERTKVHLVRNSTFNVRSEGSLVRVQTGDVPKQELVWNEPKKGKDRTKGEENDQRGPS